MYTADDARRGNMDELDDRIKYAVKNFSSGNSASLRIYHDDAFRFHIEEELEKRGFKNIHVPDFMLKGDVYFEWED